MSAHDASHDQLGAKRRVRRGRGRDPVEGFGCPRVDWPHHVEVLIPDLRGEEVVVMEDFGAAGHAAGLGERVVRCVLPRVRWNLIAGAAQREFNERLRTLGLPVWAWRTGATRVERMLGQELVLLVCAAEAADEEDVPAVAAGWAALRPEERWWFAGWITARPTRKVLLGAALLLAGGPADAGNAAGAPDATRTAQKGRRLPRRGEETALPLFEAPPAGKS